MRLRGRRPRRAPPLPAGLDERPEPGHAAANGFYPLAAGDEVDDGLTVLGHVAVGRGSHLYQVWDEREWGVFTCKVLSPSRLDDRHEAASLRREERVLRRCSHPNLVRVFHPGRRAGAPYLLMEYLEGPSLAGALDARSPRRLPVHDAVRAALQTGAALAHLHRSGWLHLDVKPANVLLRGGVPVVVDLGCTRRIGGRRPARRPGTAPYMAPEQAARGELTPATDVYGLAAMLYELLTGRWPHQDALERSGGEPFAEGPLPAPPPRRFRARLPRGLDRAVARGLEPEPARRPADMPAFLRELAPFG